MLGWCRKRKQAKAERAAQVAATEAKRAERIAAKQAADDKIMQRVIDMIEAGHPDVRCTGGGVRVLNNGSVLHSASYKLSAWSRSVFISNDQGTAELRLDRSETGERFEQLLRKADRTSRGNALRAASEL